ncbi:hypothetical protein G7K_4821-t1 [Saitoella complicata NRRL Y-17804]|uniref:Uncharacterized protein n=1 Tax=Saitoella complicata (strain BCRC 22490 / CBS 7301 / JCM 7358 / NBRC 10748 / NRRL Y-17804) TaxID=698492 RepID=A0A0E9NMQ0_SAICN|nr:hypothetical protein G7K_4821-t1 [Saitoella complicata NRRL Y-17804]
MSTSAPGAMVRARLQGRKYLGPGSPLTSRHSIPSLRLYFSQIDAAGLEVQHQTQDSNVSPLSNLIRISGVDP